MAVYTKVTKRDLQRFLLDYKLGDLTFYQGIMAGVENTNYLLYFSEDKYILTLFEKRVAIQNLPFYFRLHNHLANKAIACPNIIARDDKELISELCNRKAVILSFIEGQEVLAPTNWHCSMLGRLVARMHLAVSDFPERIENKFSIASWRSLWHSSREKALYFGQDIVRFIEDRLIFLEQNWRSDLPSGVIHADIFPDNVLFKGEELGGVIDFYFSCYDMFAYDVAICLTAWCFNEKDIYDISKAEAFLKAYQSIRLLTRSEKEALPLLMQGSAMRFLQTRMYDFFHTKSGSNVILKDPMSYVRRLQYYAACSNLKDLGLE